MGLQHGAELVVHQPAVLDDKSTVHDGMPCLVGAAPEPTFNEVVENTGIREAVQFPNGEVRYGSDRDLAELTLSS